MSSLHVIRLGFILATYMVPEPTRSDLEHRVGVTPVEKNGETVFVGQGNLQFIQPKLFLLSSPSKIFQGSFTVTLRCSNCLPDCGTHGLGAWNPALFPVLSKSPVSISSLELSPLSS